MGEDTSDEEVAEEILMGDLEDNLVVLVGPMFESEIDKEFLL
jgi:hypothetical protein